MRVAVIGCDSALGQAVARSCSTPPATLESAHALSADAVQACVRGADVAYHCVPVNLARVLDVFFATVVLVDACRRTHTRIIYPGTPWSSARGGRRPAGRVGRELFQTEYLLRTAYEAWRLPYTIVRLPDLVGPGVEALPFGPVWRDAVAGEPRIRIWVDADGAHEMIHVEDAARALHAVGDAPHRRREIAAPGGLYLSARALATALAKSAPPRVDPLTWIERALRCAADPAARAFASLRSSYAKSARTDGSAIAETGYAPRVIALP